MTEVAEVALPVPNSKAPHEFSFHRYHVDLFRRSVRKERLVCQDQDDVLGGIARGFKLFEDPALAVDDAYDPRATLVMNLGILSGTDFMTGLRTYFIGYSPLKVGDNGMPATMWSAGSCKFGTKLRWLGIDEVLFTGRLSRPSLLRISEGPDGEARFEFEDAQDLVGLRVNAKVQALYRRFPEAHFAVIGPSGERFAHCRFAGIALSTVNQLKSGDPKPRWCGRGGFGGVLGSKNLLAIVADVVDKKQPPAPANLKELNQVVARGDGSKRFRDARKGNGGGGTWANYQALNPVHAVPEYNFAPTGTDISFPLHRPAVEAEGRVVVKDEACYRCGIACHKNVYLSEGGKPGKFLAKLDYEPLNLLASNIGIFDIVESCELVELVDELGMDSISCGVTLSYAMEWNRRYPQAQIADGVCYGDFHKARDTIIAMGEGRLPLLGQGSKRLARMLGPGALDFAMQCKGMEFPAYMPHTNPGYPWALAGGHMSMRTYLLAVFEKETGIDYWENAITTRGLSIMRDDIVGICKFSGVNDGQVAEAIQHLTGLRISADDLKEAIRRAYLRGFVIEGRQGFTAEDYVMPAEVHRHHRPIQLPYFNTPQFFLELRGRVLARFAQMARDAGLAA